MIIYVYINVNAHLTIYCYLLCLDAVTVVLYNMMKAFNEMDTVPIGEVRVAFLSMLQIKVFDSSTLKQ